MTGGPTVSDLVTQWVERCVADCAAPPVLGLSGAQGIGKSRACRALTTHETLRIAVVGLDDVYLPRAARQQMAADVHPLFETRGPPGTHDLALLTDTVTALRNADGNTPAVPLPRFGKAADDRLDRSAWPVFDGVPDAIVIEGWMVGAAPDPEAPMARALNDVEREDSEGDWRRVQEEALQGPYARLWDSIDAFLHLDAPDFSVIEAWRVQQEEETLGVLAGTLPEARQRWVHRFIQHYERITRRMLAGGRRAGDIIAVSKDRDVVRTSLTA